MEHPEHALDAQSAVTERAGLGRDEMRRTQQHEAAATSTGTNGKMHRGRNAALAAAGGYDEDTPLLAREETTLEDSEVEDDRGDGDDPAPEWPGLAAFAGLPWYRRPSIFWLLPSLLVHTLAFGGILVPKLSLILKLVCRDYFADKAMRDPNFTFTPVIFDGTTDNPQCKDAIIQKLVAEFTLAMQLIAGLMSMVVAPKLGALSDRYGRTRIIAYCGLGVLLNEIITVLAASYPEVVSVNWILVGAFLDGASGTFITAMAVTTAYAADCTPPAQRGIRFGWIHGCLFTGIAVGPFLASIVMGVTGSPLTVFYIALGVHAFFLVYTLFVVPESLSKDRQMVARANIKAAEADLAAIYAVEGKPWHRRGIGRVLTSPKELFEPLSILWPKGPGSTPALRRNLALLAAIDGVLFGVAMGAMTVVVYYSKWKFEWGDVQSSNFVGIVCSVRVLSVLVLLPIITRIVRGKPRQDARQPVRSTGSDHLDLALLRVGIFLDVLGYVGYSTVETGGMFIASGCLAALGGFASPTMQSSLTKHVPSEVTGQLLGATGLLHSFARVVAPLIFNLIYAQTVQWRPKIVFICLCATFGVAWVLSLFLRPHVYMEVYDGDSPLSRQGSRRAQEEEEEEQTDERIIG